MPKLNVPLLPCRPPVKLFAASTTFSGLASTLYVEVNVKGLPVFLSSVLAARLVLSLGTAAAWTAVNRPRAQNEGLMMIDRYVCVCVKAVKLLKREVVDELGDDG